MTSVEIRYRGFSFAGNDAGTYDVFLCPIPHEEDLPEVFLKFPSGIILHVPEINEASLGNDFTRHPTLERDDLVLMDYEFRGSWFSFRNEKLKSVIIHSDSGVTVSLAKEGPFLKLPATRREIERAFGTPVRIVKSEHTIPFH